MVFADVLPSDVGSWLLSGAAVVGAVVGVLAGINQWRKLVAPPPSGEKYVTASELGNVEARLKAELIRVEQDQTRRTTDLDMYWRTQFHEIRDKLQDVTNKIALLPTEIYKAIGEVARPIHNRLEKGAILMAQIATRLKISPSNLLDENDKGE